MAIMRNFGKGVLRESNVGESPRQREAKDCALELVHWRIFLVSVAALLKLEIS